MEHGSIRIPHNEYLERVQRAAVPPAQVAGAGGQAVRPVPQQAAHRRLPGGGEGHPPVHKAAQPGPVFRRVQALCGPLQHRERPRLAAEGQVGDNARPRQKGHRSPGEALRRGHGPHRGQLQHQIRAPGQGQGGAGPLVRQGAVRALDPMPAHGAHDPRVRPQQAARLGEVPGVPRVKRVIFGHDYGHLPRQSSEN